MNKDVWDSVDLLWRPPQGDFACSDTMCIRDEKGQRLESVGDDPGANQYRVRLDGCIRFAPADRGKRFTIEYQYRPRRVAILPAVLGSDYQDAAPTLLETVRRQLEPRGFLFASADDVADSFVQERVGEGSPAGSAERLSAAAIRTLARSIDAAYLLLPGVDASENEVLAGFQTHTWISGSGRSAHSTSTASERHYMNAAVGLLVFDGTTGEPVFEDVAAGSKRVRFRQFGPARRDLIRDLTRRLVTQWRGSGDG